MTTIYLAGPISGKQKQDVFDYWDAQVRLFEDMGYKALSPMTGKDQFRLDSPHEKFLAGGYLHGPAFTDHSIFFRDKWMVSQADIIYCNLSTPAILEYEYQGSIYEEEQVSIGSVMEIAIANTLGKMVVLALPEDNAHRHAFVVEAATTIFETHEECVDYLRGFV